MARNRERSNRGLWQSNTRVFPKGPIVATKPLLTNSSEYGQGLVRLRLLRSAFVLASTRSCAGNSLHRSHLES